MKLWLFRGFFVEPQASLIHDLKCYEIWDIFYGATAGFGSVCK